VSSMSLHLQLWEAVNSIPKLRVVFKQRKRCAKPRKGGIVAKKRKPLGRTPHQVVEVGEVKSVVYMVVGCTWWPLSVRSERS
jgi:hypothetical protein